MDESSFERRLRASGAVDVDEMLAGKTVTISDSRMKKAQKRKKEVVMRVLRDGDPFPFIRYEWPDLLITDREELADFKYNCLRTDNLDLRLDDFQVDFIRSTFDRMHTRVFGSGGTKLGKGCIVGGIIVNTWFDMHPDSKIVMRGPDVDHVRPPE